MTNTWSWLLIPVLGVAGGCAGAKPVREPSPVPANKSERAVEVVRLKHAVATEIVSALDSALEMNRRAILHRSGCSTHEPGQEGEWFPVRWQAAGLEASVVADPRSNSVIASAADSVKLSCLLDMIARLDVDPDSHESSSKHLPFGVVLLSGESALTQPATKTTRTQVVPIRHVGADELAAELVKQTKTRAGDAVTITVDPRTNSLILACPPGYFDELAELRTRVGELDDCCRSEWMGTGTVCGRPVFTHVVFLRFAPASEVAEQVECLHPGARIVQDPRTNSLKVRTESEQDLGEALLEIGRLDREEPPQH